MFVKKSQSPSLLPQAKEKMKNNTLNVEEILDEEDILQDLKSPNSILVQ